VYEDIKILIRTRIENGELASGERVPSEYELARELGVSRHRTRLALRELEVEGYVIRQRGSGTYVAPVPSRIPAAELNLDRTVVITFPKFESKYARRVVEGFMGHVGEAKVPAIAYHLHSDHESEVQALRSIVDSGVSGVVAWLEHDTPTMRAFLESLGRRRFPVVLVDRYFNTPGIDNVASANEEMGYQLTKALLAKGHRRIAFAGYKPAVSSIEDRCRGYRRAMNEARDQVGDGALVLNLKDIWEDCSTAIQSVMALRDRPTAFMCMHDKVMLHVHAETAALGYETPEDVAFACVDDMHPSEEFSQVPLAMTLAQDAIAVGTESAKVLLTRIEFPEAPVIRIAILPGPMVEKSIGVPSLVPASA
jgi:GntR family transcriptional regulator of arabinose operon